jgi:hypothetical protein
MLKKASLSYKVWLLIPELSYKRLEKFQSRHYTVRPFLQSFNPHEDLGISCEEGIEFLLFIYTAPKGNFVFNAATCWWNMFLSYPPGSQNPNQESIGYKLTSKKATSGLRRSQRIFLKRF